MSAVGYVSSIPVEGNVESNNMPPCPMSQLEKLSTDYHSLIKDSVLQRSPRKPSARPTKKIPSAAPRTKNPSVSPITKSPITKKPSVSPITKKPTTAPSYKAFSRKSYCAKTKGAALTTNAANICSAYKAILAGFQTTYGTADDFTLSNLFGKAVRVAFHDAAEFDRTTTDVLGSDGCLSNSEDNLGLLESNSIVNTVFEPLWQRYCDKISRADFWVMLAKIAIEKSEPTNTISIPYQWGRKDTSKSCEPPTERLPNAMQGPLTFHSFFEHRLGLTLNDTVALMGAHTVGHVHTTASKFGYIAEDLSADVQANAWDPTPFRFDNQYYQNIVTPRGWGTFPAPADSELVMWQRFGNRNIMLHSDIALFFNISLANGGLGVPGTVDPTTGAQGCGFLNENPSTPGCVGPLNVYSPKSRHLVEIFAADNAAFLKAFAVSFNKLVNLGRGVSGSKLGPSLKEIDLTKC
eukprot:gene27926-36788_t